MTRFTSPKFPAAIATVLAAVALAAPVGPRAVAEETGPYVQYEEYFPSADGVMLHAYVSRPANPPPGGAPVILTVTPYAGWAGGPLGPNPFNTSSPGPGARSDGYARAVVELRGTGGSGGCEDLFGPGEVADAKAAVERYADEPWSNGRVGMTGHSYAGFTQVGALAAGARGLAAIVAGAPPVGYHNFFMDGVRATGGGHGFMPLYLASDVYPPGPFAPMQQTTNSLTPSEGCWVNTLGSYDDDPRSPYWVERDLSIGAAGSEVPTIWIHGFNDWQVRPNGFTAIFPTLRGPKLGIFGPWDHGIPRNASAAPGFSHDEIVDRWFARFLKGDESVEVPTGVWIQDFDGSWREEGAWPAPDASPHVLPIRDGSYQDMLGSTGETGLPAAFPLQPPTPMPTARNGYWTFTQTLPHEVRFSGVPEIRAHVGSLVPNVHIVTLVYDIDPEGNARIVSRGASLVAAAGTHTFELYPQDWSFPAGHRIGIFVGGADDIFFEPGTSGTPVTVTEASATLRFLASAGPDLPEGPYRPRNPTATFQVPAATIAAGTIEAELPPPLS